MARKKSRGSHDQWEAIFRGVLSVPTCSMKDILVGLHNACVHGEVLGEALDDADLADFYEKLDALLKTSVARFI